jgi:hypothetical protein
VEIYAIRVLSLGFLDEVSEFYAIYSYAINTSWKIFYFILGVSLGETIREENK